MPWGFSQSPEVKTHLFNEENGLSRYANCIHKDRRGIIWAGTDYGLYRFDRDAFVKIEANMDLPFRQVMEIYEDAEGWFWLYKSCWSKGKKCERNLVFFHPITKEVLTLAQRFGNQATISPGQISSIIQDSITVYFTADHTLFMWSVEKGIRVKKLKGFAHTPVLFSKISSNTLGAFYTPNEITTKGQYMSLDTNGFIRHTEEQLSIAPEIILAFYNLSSECLSYSQVCMKDLVFYFAPSGKMIMDTLSTEMPYFDERSIAMEWTGRFYANDAGHVYHPDYGIITDPTSFFSPLYHTRNIKNEIFTNIWVRSNQVPDSNFNFVHYNTSGRSNFYDKSTQTQWKASRAGVKTVEFSPRYFQHIRNNKSSRQLTSAALAIGEEKALLNIDGHLFLFQAPDQLTQLSQHVELQNPLQVLTSYDDSRDYWGACKGALVRVSETSGIHSKYAHQAINQISSLIHVDGSLWVGCDTQIICFDPQTEQFSKFNGYNEFKGAKSEQVRCLLEKDQSHIWILTDTKLHLCSKDKGIIAAFGGEQTRLHLPPNGRFNHLYKSKNNGWWLTSDKGVFHFSMTGNKLNKLEHYHEKNGLPNSEIFATFEDDFGFLWMNTPTGLIQFHLQTGLSKLYTKADGLSSSGIGGYGNAIGPKGTMYFGGIDGFNIFHPKDFKEVELIPSVPLIMLECEQHVDKTSQIENRLQEVLTQGKIVLESGDKLFSIRVALADYREAGQHRFAYRIEGFQEEWAEDRTNLIRISGLPYGEYTLQIKGQLHNGIWSTSILEVPIKVLRPFYLQAWFLATGILSLFLVAFSLYRWRIHQLTDQQKKLEVEISKATQTIRKQNAELRNLDRVKSRFFANISHELRTPITLILGPLGSLLKGTKLNEKDRSFANLGVKNARNLLKLVNEILVLTKMESGNIQLEAEPTDFFPFLSRIVEAFEGLAQQKSIHYQLEYHLDKSLRLMLDPQKIEKLVNNLLSNAFKFTPQNGSITIRVENGRSTIHMSIQDTGRGIHPDDLPYVFDRYYQSAQPNVPKEGGFGIGLSLSAEFANLMNGELWATSELGKGSTFYFEFPRKMPSNQEVLSDDKSLRTKRVLRAETRNGNRQKASLTAVEPVTLLLVEDNEDLREYIRLIIGDRYEVVTAENGKVGWDYLTETHQNNQTDCPNLIISDIMMPEMDGYQFLEKLKADPRFLGTPVIMLTALAELQDKLKALRIGVDDYITKPFEEEELLARIENLLHNGRERKQFYLEQIQAETSAESQAPSPPPTGEETSISPSDLAWLEKLERTIKGELGNSQFKIDDLPQILYMSRTKLFRRIKQLTGLTPNQYLREVRLNEAKTLLETKRSTSVKATALSIGFRDISYFSKLYKERFGKLPSAYL